MRYQVAGSVERGFRKEKWLVPTFLSERRLLPSPPAEAGQFSSFPYTTGAFPAPVLVLEFRRGESELSLYVGSLRETAWESTSFFHQFNSHWFAPSS